MLSSVQVEGRLRLRCRVASNDVGPDATGQPCMVLLGMLIGKMDHRILSVRFHEEAFDWDGSSAER